LTGKLGSETAIAGVGSTFVTTSDMIRGSGLSPSAAGDSFSSVGWTGEATDYMEFGINMASGYQASLGTLTIATRSSNTGPGTMGLYSSLDGFATPVTTFTQSGTAFTNSIVDLSSLSGITCSFTLRLKQIGTNSANGGVTAATGTFRIAEYLFSGVYTDVQIKGTIAPATGIVSFGDS
jgi:hypothetical protein